jgi:Ala-tRNA(Pro) deacylase
MLARRLKRYLDEQKIEYRRIQHPVAFTARETADRAGIPAFRMAKTVVVMVNAKPALVVLPSTETIDLQRFGTSINARTVCLANENKMASMFPGCELGAMPPFGLLYGLPVYAERDLSDDRVIVFNGGTHGELIEMSYEDFSRLTKPTLVKAAAR